MAQIVFAAGAPHAPAIVGLFDKAPDDSKKVVNDTYAAISRELRAAKPDVVIVFANDHLTNSRITFYPGLPDRLGPEHSRSARMVSGMDRLPRLRRQGQSGSRQIAVRRA